jgi:hypothetical protein
LNADFSESLQDYDAPLPVQAFTVSLFVMIGIAMDRSIVAGAGDVSGYFALSSGAVGCIWAGTQFTCLVHKYNWYKSTNTDAGGRLL